MKEKDLTEKMKREYKEVYIWEDKAGEVYERHNHSYETKLIILSGSIRINRKNLKSGDEIIIKTKEYHEALVGSRGCKYLVGEKRK